MAAPHIPYHSRPVAESYSSEGQMSRLHHFISQKAFPQKAANHTAAPQEAFTPVVQQSDSSVIPIPVLNCLPVATPSHNPAGLIGSLRPERIRTPQACERCRARKSKCCGTRPSCKRCLKGGKECVYVEDHKANRPKKEKKHALRGAEAQHAFREVQHLSMDYATMGSRLPSLDTMKNLQATYEESQFPITEIPTWYGCPAIAVTDPMSDAPTALPSFDYHPMRKHYELPNVSMLHPRWQPTALQMLHLQQKAHRSSSRSRREQSSRLSLISGEGSIPQPHPEGRQWHSAKTKPPFQFWSSSATTMVTDEPDFQLSTDGSYEVVNFAPSDGFSATAQPSAQTGLSSSPSWDLLTTPTEHAPHIPSSESADAELALAAELEREMVGIFFEEDVARFLPMPAELEQRLANAVATNFPPSPLIPYEEDTAQFLPMPAELEQRLANAVAANFPSSPLIPPSNLLCMPASLAPLDTAAFVDITAEELAEAEAYLDRFMQRDEVSMDVDPVSSSFTPSCTDSTLFVPPIPSTVLQTTPSLDAMDLELQKWMTALTAPVGALNMCLAHPFGCPTREDDMDAEIKAVADAMAKATVDDSSASDSLRDLWVELFGGADE